MRLPPIFSSPRSFQVWEWSVGHSRLLLRSNPGTEGESRIEISFKPVRAVCLPHRLDGLHIAVTQSHANMPSLIQRSASPTNSLFSLGNDCFVAAGSVHGRQDQRDYAAPPMFTGYAPIEGVRELFSYSAPD